MVCLLLPAVRSEDLLTSSDERTVATIVASVKAIEAQYPIYASRRRDYKRGSLPSNSLPEHVSGSGEPAMPEQDDLDKRGEKDWATIRAAMTIVAYQTRLIESTMAFWVNATKRLEDPDEVHCANPGCPDNKVWSMMPGDRPQRSDRRCEACHKYVKRNGRERTTMRAEAGRIKTATLEKEPVN
jgi:hypothetical protein